MPDYRVYFLNGDNKINNAAELQFANDEEAIDNVQRLQSAQAMELWRGSELVKRFLPSILPHKT